MNEYKHLPWPVSDVGTNIEEVYALNMTEYKSKNPTDVFFCHLMETEPIHLEGIHSTNANDNTEAHESHQFIDPRTGVEIESQECNYRNTKPESRNIFLKSHIHDSKLKKHEHLACLNALRQLNKSVSELSDEEKKDRLLFKSSAQDRLAEKDLFLEKIRENYLIFNRFHDVPPAINHFVTENWKRRLIVMQQKLANVRYRMRTAISQQPPDCTVETEVIHREHLGNIPIMTSQNIEYLRQSSTNLTKTYNSRKSKHLEPIIRKKIEELVQEHGVDFVIPISMLKLLLSSKQVWSSCISVRNSAQSNVFNQKNEIIFEKPLPKSYYSGNERFKIGSKYLLRSCFNQNALHVFNHNEQIEKRTAIHTKNIELNAETSGNFEYKVSNSDEFIRNHSKIDDSYANMSFSIFNISGLDNMEDGSEAFKILVPAKQDAYKKNENDEIRFLNYSPKIEYQYEYGAEVMGKDELICEWCDLYFRPDTITERVRFDCKSGKIAFQQSITLAEVEDKLNIKCGIDKKNLLQRLWHILQTFSVFPAGDFLLQSDAKQPNCIRVYEKCSDIDGSIGISQIIKDVSFDRNLFDKVNWQPIDDEIITKIHEQFHILPCAFPHDEYLNEYNVQPIKKSFVKCKTNKKKELLKICPQDDRQQIIGKVKLKQKERERQFRAKDSANKHRKKTAYRARRRARSDAISTEANETESAKQLLIQTMDHYNSATGEPFQQPESSISTTSIVERMRTRSTSNSSPEKQQNHRRSGRFPVKK